ncbi:orotate phosphoribosyltransferase [Rickettsiales bacterium]|nr:orotate phosphoribosyltransferase [Rickettsiales bacterium]
MQQEQLLNEFIKAKAILKGHFILSSGLHSDTYMQCARVLMNHERSEKLCSILANKLITKLGNNFADIVVAPAMGGVVVGYEMGRHLGLDAIFCERVNGRFELRRGFEIKENDRVLVVEDVVTTGLSSLESYECIRRNGGQVVAQCSLIDRSNGQAAEKLGVPFVPLIDVDVKVFNENSVPDNLKNIEAIKPGSRFIKK